MKADMKKRLAALGLTTVMALSLAACGEKAPSREEVAQAIEAGTLTIEDALEKGWIDQTWVDDYTEKNSVPAANKVDAGRVGEFTTTTLAGDEFTKADLGSVLLFAFVDPSSEDSASFYEEMVNAYDGVQDAGAEMILCLKGEDKNGQYAEAPFPVIYYNDSLKAALGNNAGMVEGGELHNTASWYVNGSFLSAWYITLDAAELPEIAASYVEAGQENGGGNTASAGDDAAAMVPMG